MGFYECLLEEASREKRSPDSNEEVPRYGKVWRHPAHEVSGYLTVEDLEREQERLQQERQRVQQEKDKRSSEIRVLRSFARYGVSSPVQGIAFKNLQRKYLAEWDRIRWE